MWAMVSECGCGCHTTGYVGHERLCCEYPNVLKKENPFTDLESATHYEKEYNDYLYSEEDLRLP